MLNWESEITNILQSTLPKPLALRSISNWTPSVVFARRVPLPCIAAPEGPVMESELIIGLERLQIHVLGFIFCFTKKRLPSYRMSEKISAFRSLADICFLNVLYGMWSSLITGCGMSLVYVVICIVVYICLSPKLIGIHPSGCERHRIQIFFSVHRPE